MDRISVRPIAPADYDQAYALQQEYLDVEPQAKFIARIETQPELYLVALDGCAVVGVCYGGPSAKVPSTCHVQGIAVNLDQSLHYARKGIGSKMLSVFRTTAVRLGYQELGLGAAEDEKVEKFYLKNRFMAFELVAKQASGVEIARIPILDYESGVILREDLRRRYQPHEIIFIFRQSLCSD